MCIGETRPEQVPLRASPNPQAGGGGHLGPGPCSSDAAPLGPRRIPEMPFLPWNSSNCILLLLFLKEVTQSCW